MEHVKLNVKWRSSMPVFFLSCELPSKLICCWVYHWFCWNERVVYISPTFLWRTSSFRSTWPISQIIYAIANKITRFLSDVHTIHRVCPLLMICALTCTSKKQKCWWISSIPRWYLESYMQVLWYLHVSFLFRKWALSEKRIPQNLMVLSWCSLSKFLGQPWLETLVLESVAINCKFY